MVNAIRSQGLHPFYQPLVVKNDFVRARRPSRWLFSGRAYRTYHTCSTMPRERDRAHTDSASGPLHQHRLPRYGTANKDGAMGRDAGYPEASAFIRRDALRERRDMIERHNRELGSRAEWAIGLGSVAPYSPADPFRRHALTDLVYHPSAIAMRNNPRVRHAQPK
jgi:hypothetical protein